MNSLVANGDSLVLNEMLFKHGVRPVLDHIADICKDVAIHDNMANLGMSDKNDRLEPCDLKTMANNLKNGMY